MLRLTLTATLHNFHRFVVHLNPRYVNVRTLGMSPALYYVLTSKDLEHEAALRVFEKYGRSEVDVFLASAHLLRGESKYKCVFKGKTPMEPGMLACGCLKVMKDNLSRSSFLIALLALTLRYCDCRNLTERCVVTPHTRESLRRLLHKIHKHLKRKTVDRPKLLCGKWCARTSLFRSENLPQGQLTYTN